MITQIGSRRAHVCCSRDLRLTAQRPWAWADEANEVSLEPLVRHCAAAFPGPRPVKGRSLSYLQMRLRQRDDPVYDMRDGKAESLDQMGVVGGPQGSNGALAVDFVAALHVGERAGEVGLSAACRQLLLAAPGTLVYGVRRGRF